jgi:hypothetical protein
LNKWGVDPALSTPHYPQSNGHSDSSVRAMKNLVIKTSLGDTKSFQQGLLEFRNTLRADGRSPAQVVFGHLMRSMVPAHYRSFANEWQQTAAESDEKGAKLHLRQKENYDKSARQIEPPKVGEEVLIQHHVTKRWSKTGKIIKAGKNRDYHV